MLSGFGKTTRVQRRQRHALRDKEADIGRADRRHIQTGCRLEPRHPGGAFVRTARRDAAQKTTTGLDQEAK